MAGVAALDQHRADFLFEEFESFGGGFRVGGSSCRQAEKYSGSGEENPHCG